MKKILSAILAALMLTGAFTSCSKKEITPDTTVATTSSEADTYGEWLTERLGYAPENVVLGIGSDESYGIDIATFEDDGYILRTVGDITLIFGKTADGLDRAVRAYAKAVEGGRADSLNEVFHEGYRVKRLTIAGRDISEYTVCYPETANENMKFAADELVRLIEKATGVRLPIVVGASVSPAIEFRHTDNPDFRDEGYRYEVTENGVLIEGAVDRGCMNGVYRFLQWELGWEGLAYKDSFTAGGALHVYGDSYLLSSDHITISVGTERTETPAFDYYKLYNPYYSFSNERATPTIAQAGYGAVWQAWHGLSTYNFFQSTSFDSQPCYTDEELYEICRDNVEAYIISRYGDPSFKSVDIAQYDTSDYCFCETCYDTFIEEGYTNAGAVVRFANRLSEEMDELYPGLKYLIFAYHGTNVPPKTAPNDLVYVTYCFDLNCSNHTIDGKNCSDKDISMGRKANEYAKWFEGWCDLTDNIYVWYYTLGTALQAYTVIDNIYADYKYFVEKNVKGVFLETENFGEFGIKRIENQLEAEMIWNTNITPEEFDAVYRRLLEREYGPGWSLVHDYIRQQEASQDLMDCWQCWGWNLTGCWDHRYSTFYYANGFDTYCDLIESAIDMAESREQEDRLNRLYVTILYMGCYSSYYPAYLEGDTERMRELSDRYDLCMKLVRDMGYDPTNLPTISGGGYIIRYSPTIEEAAWKDWLEWFPTITGKPLPEDAPVIK